MDMDEARGKGMILSQAQGHSSRDDNERHNSETPMTVKEKKICFCRQCILRTYFPSYCPSHCSVISMCRKEADNLIHG